MYLRDQMVAWLHGGVSYLVCGQEKRGFPVRVSPVGQTVHLCILTENPSVQLECRSLKLLARQVVLGVRGKEASSGLNPPVLGIQSWHDPRQTHIDYMTLHRGLRETVGCSPARSA